MTIKSSNTDYKRGLYYDKDEDPSESGKVVVLAVSHIGRVLLDRAY